MRLTWDNAGVVGVGSIGLGHVWQHISSRISSIVGSYIGAGGNNVGVSTCNIGSVIGVICCCIVMVIVLQKSQYINYSKV